MSFESIAGACRGTRQTLRHPQSVAVRYIRGFVNLPNIADIRFAVFLPEPVDRLSGGLRQKLAIGRAFLKKPRILIMDEATSALDNKSQTRIQTLLDTHWKGKATLIAVVHRLDIIKNFDKIGVMKSGKIEEMGSYEELMANKSLLY